MNHLESPVRTAYNCCIHRILHNTGMNCSNRRQRRDAWLRDRAREFAGRFRISDLRKTFATWHRERRNSRHSTRRNYCTHLMRLVLDDVRVWIGSKLTGADNTRGTCESATSRSSKSEQWNQYDQDLNKTCANRDINGCRCFREITHQTSVLHRIAFPKPGFQGGQPGAHCTSAHTAVANIARATYLGMHGPGFVEMLSPQLSVVGQCYQRYWSERDCIDIKGMWQDNANVVTGTGRPIKHRNTNSKRVSKRTGHHIA